MKKKQYFRVILFCAALSVFLFAGSRIYMYLFYNHTDQKFLSELAGNAVTVTTFDKNSVIQGINRENEAPITVDFEMLWQENKDIIAWIYCADTPINYPIVQSNDNDYYLRRRLDGQYSTAGTLFLDYRNSADFLNRNSIVYGHNMKVDTMFGTLVDYCEQAYYDAHPIMWLITPQQSYKIELFAGYFTEPISDAYSLQENETDFKIYVNSAFSKSTFSSPIQIDDINTIITMSTCSDTAEDTRYVVLGNLVPTV